MEHAKVTEQERDPKYSSRYRDYVQARGSVVQVLEQARNWPYSTTAQIGCSPPSPLYNRYWRSFPVVEKLGREFSHSSPSRAEARMSGTIPLSPYTLAWRGQG